MKILWLFKFEELDEDPLTIQSDSFEEFPSKTVKGSNISIIDYSRFDYEPNELNSNINIEEITNDIYNINKKFPTYKIIEVFELKYKEKYSIEEIATKLNMDKQTVEESLNELLSII